MAPMNSMTYVERRTEIENYFDRTAVDAWSRLTSDAPVNRIRATVRAGRDEMRRTLLEWLPADLRGRRLLDAGCGTGALADEAARRGASVVAIDLSPTLINLARSRTSTAGQGGDLEFLAGDMLDPKLGEFDHVVAMDSLIHYGAADMIDVIVGLAARARHSLLFTFAPRTPVLGLMHAVGRLFPRGNRAPAIEPIDQSNLTRQLGRAPQLASWHASRTRRVQNGFYISQALELTRS
jgi:magnesium-protoporphyrin O-methyltransferase